MINPLHFILERGSESFHPSSWNFYIAKLCLDVAALEGSHYKRGSRELLRFAFAKSTSFKVRSSSFSSTKQNTDQDETRFIFQVKIYHRSPYIYLGQNYFHNIEFCSKNCYAMYKVTCCLWFPSEHLSLYQDSNYRVFRAQADWTFILPSELPAKLLRHLTRKMPPRGTTFWKVW
jgi:hypothetical protein